MTSLDTVKPPTALEAVLAELRREIASGRLAPGAQLVQEDIAQRYGVSRVPVREALRILEGEGQLTYHAHRGYFVALLSVDDLDEVYRLRELLETEALRQAVLAVTDDDIVELKVQLARMEEASAAADVTRLTQENRSFHFAMFGLADSPRLERLIRLLWDATDAYRAVYFIEGENRARVQAEHQGMVEALAARDATALIAVQDSHRRYAQEVVSELLRRHTSITPPGV